MKRWALVAVVVACAYPQEHFIEDYADVFCDWDEGCGGAYYATAQGCRDVLMREGENRIAECRYDSAASRACLSELRDLPCSSDWPQTFFDAFVCSGNLESP